MWHRRVGVGVDDGAGLLRVCCVNGARAAHALLSGALQGAHQHAKHFAVALLTPSPPLPSSPLPSPPLPSSPHALSSRPCAHASRGVRERAGAPAAHRGTHVPRSSLEAQHRPLSSQAMHASILQLLRPPRQHCLRRARGEAGSRSCQGLPPSQVSRPPPRRPRRSSAAADIRWVETSTRSTERAAWNDGKTAVDRRISATLRRPSSSPRHSSSPSDRALPSSPRIHPLLSLCTALERVVAGFKLLFLLCVCVCVFCICSFADDDDTTRHDV